jgi:polysaccharide export outer membrane protein
MNKFLILSISWALILSLQTGSFAQDKGVVNGNSSDQNVELKQAEQSTITVGPIPPCRISDAYGSSKEYTVGVGDILDINVLKPEELAQTETVAPDGAITFPYIGSVVVKGHTIEQIQDEIQSRLGDGFMKYPVVSVSLKESLSRNFFVYGEVVKPGSYPIQENMTVLRAISMAGGFSKFGSSSSVKVLRAKKSGVGYNTITVNIKRVMDGDSDEDVTLVQGDIVTISEGVF